MIVRPMAFKVHKRCKMLMILKQFAAVDRITTRYWSWSLQASKSFCIILRDHCSSALPSSCGDRADAACIWVPLDDCLSGAPFPCTSTYQGRAALRGIALCKGTGLAALAQHICTNANPAAARTCPKAQD